MVSKVVGSLLGRCALLCAGLIRTQPEDSKCFEARVLITLHACAKRPLAQEADMLQAIGSTQDWRF